MLHCETPVARAANRDRRTREETVVAGWEEAWDEWRNEDKGRWKRERERGRESCCACSPSNCALRAVAGNERGATGGGVYSILFALPLPSLFVPFFFFFFLLSRSLSLSLFSPPARALAHSRFLGPLYVRCYFPLSLSLSLSFFLWLSHSSYVIQRTVLPSVA